jgi:hypothetical protein
MIIEVTTEKFDVTKVKESIETSQLVYGNEKNKITANAPVTSRMYIENKHLHNPIKGSIVIQLVQREQIRGHIFLIERCFVFDGEQQPILVASDLVSKVDIPGASLIIFRKAVQHCKDRNIPLVNFSNKDSDKIYSQIMRIEPVIELDFQLGYFNLRSIFLILRKQLNFQSEPALVLISNKVKVIDKKLKIRLIPDFDESIDAFFGKLEKENVFFGKRSSEILNWRFNPSNEIDYARILISREEIVVGYLVLCERTFKGLRFLMIVDYVMWNLSTIEIYRIKKELKKAYPGAAACLWSSNLLHKNRALGKFKGLTIPRRFSPERVKFYLSGGSNSLKMNLKKAHLTLFDTDIL